jgi:hypothetical protein
MIRGVGAGICWCREEKMKCGRRNVISNGKPVVWALAVAVAVSVFPSTQAFRREVEVDEKSAD